MCYSDEGLNEQEFLTVNAGDTVLVGEDEIYKVISFVGGSKDPDAPSLFQVANVDTCELSTFTLLKLKRLFAHESSNSTKKRGGA